MATKRMLADVLWEAANRWLHPTSVNDWFSYSGAGCSFSCHAVSAAVQGVAPDNSYEAQRDLGSDVDAFLHTLGCDGSVGWIRQHLEAGGTRESVQGIRYMWLLLAMHVAEDEGIEV